MENNNQKPTEYKTAKIKSDKRLRDIMAEYYLLSKLPKDQGGKKIAWITSGGPVEPLVAMDVTPIYPENYAAVVGAAKDSGPLCQKAEEMGYSADLCSYARADIGCAEVNGGPLGGLPEPDMLICCNNICGTVLKWYEVQARRFNAPLFILDTPVCHTEYNKEISDYVELQIGEYLSFLEETCGEKFDYDRLTEVGLLSVKAQELWRKILDVNIHKPVPMTCFDAFFHLAVIVTLRGTQTAVDYYEGLLAEMEDRIAQKIAIVPNEKYRLIWDNIPVWPRIRWMSEKLASHDACLVADSYTSGWCSSMEYLNPDDFLSSMAECYTRIFLNAGADQMADNLIGMLDKYDAQGVVLHSNRSCKPYSFGQYDIQRIIREKTGLPGLIIEADMNDERNFSEGQIATRLDAFIETLK